MAAPAGGLGPSVLVPFYQFVNFLCQPVIFYTGVIVAFFAAIAFRKIFVKPMVALGLLLASFVFIGISAFNPQFAREAAKPDNVPLWIMLYLTGLCLWAAFYQAVNNDERIKQGLRPDEAEAAEEKLHVWPYLVYIEGIVAAFVLVLMFIWSMGLEAPLEQFANPAKSPNPAKAPWYFLGLQELLVYYDPWIAGVVLPGMIITGLIALPYCDPNPKGVGYYTYEQRKFAIVTFLFGYLMLWVVLIFVGTLLRGQNWNFFGLYEPWDEHKIIAANNINISELFWQDVMNMFAGAPRDPKSMHWAMRELPGFILMGAYLTILPVIGAIVFKKFYQSLGFIRYVIVASHLVVMLSIPIKMYLRWAFNLKYIVNVTEYFFNV
ncbi:MAG TPA: hypothetical protein VEK08_07355 [Planctomycetota bacterium]|nr:hypothetical protein [Planctomycetota bacterium]